VTTERPIGVLAWTDEEHAEHYRAGKWPRRAFQDKLAPGLSIGGANDASPPPCAKAAEIERTGELLREMWRLAVRPEVRQELLPEVRCEVRREIQSAAGRRRAELRGPPLWRQYANERITATLAKDPAIPRRRVARDIHNKWPKNLPKLPKFDHFYRYVRRFKPQKV
jgi:hypothetical protein